MVTKVIRCHLDRTDIGVAYLIHKAKSRKVPPLRMEERTGILLLHHEHMAMAIGSCGRIPQS